MFNRYPERIGLFVDASNLYFHALNLNMRIDFDRFRKFFEKDRSSILAYAGYYSAIEEDVNGHRKLQGLMDFLSHHGYSVVSKPAKGYIQADGKNKIKGNMDIELALDAIEMAPRLDRAIIVSGDGDFTALVSMLRKKGVRVTVVSSQHGNMLSNDLRKAATDVLDLVDMQPHICQLP